MRVSGSVKRAYRLQTLNSMLFLFNSDTKDLDVSFWHLTQTERRVVIAGIHQIKNVHAVLDFMYGAGFLEVFQILRKNVDSVLLCLAQELELLFHFEGRAEIDDQFLPGFAVGHDDASCRRVDDFEGSGGGLEG